MIVEDAGTRGRSARQRRSRATTGAVCTQPARGYSRQPRRAGLSWVKGEMTITAGPGPFAVLLRQYRAAAGLSQDELAERAGLSRRGISDLERGQWRSREQLEELDVDRAVAFVTRHSPATSDAWPPASANDTSSPCPTARTNRLRHPLTRAGHAIAKSRSQTMNVAQSFCSPTSRSR
jgi:transcriptional regulator with XRE-family HTH domain